jgi:sensor histidine kinase YesM
MKSLLKHLNLPFRSFQIQLMIYIALIGLVPFVLSLYLLSRGVIVDIEAKELEALSSTHLRVLDHLERELNGLEGIALSINADYLMQQYMRTRSSEEQPDMYQLRRHIDMLIKLEKQKSPYELDICIIFETSYCSDVGIIPLDGERLPASVYEPVIEPIPASAESPHQYNVRYIGALHVLNSNYIQGFIVIAADFGQILDDYHTTDPSVIHTVFDPEGTLLYRFDRSMNKRTDPVEEEIRKSDAGEDKSGLIVSEKTFQAGRNTWSSYLSKPNPVPVLFLQSLRRSIFLFVGVLFLLTAISMLLYSGLFLKPLHQLRSLMKRAESGDLKAYWTAKSVQEINDLGESYNQMLNRLEELIKQVKREEALKKEAEIAALQYQLNPHFLYNTLNTIKWVAKIHKTPQIAEVVSALVRLLQASLGKKGEFLTIREEVGLIRDYMNIQKFRYGDTVDLHFEIEPVAYPCLVPRMILQPLVENALIHGLAPQKNGGRITIRAFLDRDMLICEVEDNGVGIHRQSEQPVAGMKEKMSGIGLQHIRDKIKLYYGPDYKMHVYPGKPNGTRIRLSLPIHRNEE